MNGGHADPSGSCPVTSVLDLWSADLTPQDCSGASPSLLQIKSFSELAVSCLRLFSVKHSQKRTAPKSNPTKFAVLLLGSKLA
jgi:hypothetical protein